MIYVCANGNFRKAVVLHFNVLSRPNVITQNHPFFRNTKCLTKKRPYKIFVTQLLSRPSMCGEPEQSRGNKQTLLHSDVKCQQGQVPKMTVKK